jgi:hypothetical protein
MDGLPSLRFGTENAQNYGHWGKEIIHNHHRILIPIQHVNPRCHLVSSPEKVGPKSFLHWRVYGRPFSTL